MPIYEYRRPDGTTFEVMQSFTDDALTHDPENKKIPVEKVLHAPAIHFKGKGFHNTDYGTRRRNRELKESAEKGADNYEGKQADKAAEKAKTEKKTDKAKAETKPAASSKKPKKD